VEGMNKNMQIKSLRVSIGDHVSIPVDKLILIKDGVKLELADDA
jgi:hypothetical protein